MTLHRRFNANGKFAAVASRPFPERDDDRGVRRRLCFNAGYAAAVDCVRRAAIPATRLRDASGWYRHVAAVWVMGRRHEAVLRARAGGHRLAGVQIALFADTIIPLLPTGGPSSIYYADRFYQLLIGVISLLPARPAGK